jgi:hypothetical protein
MSVELLDAAGRRRSPATLPGYRRGCVPRNKGRRYSADPPRVEEIIAVMRAAGPGDHGDRIRALVVILWRSRAADQRGALTGRGRLGAAARVGACALREGRQASRGRDG